jgi:hypothetical protein
MDPNHLLQLSGSGTHGPQLLQPMCSLSTGLASGRNAGSQSQNRSSQGTDKRREGKEGRRAKGTIESPGFLDRPVTGAKHVAEGLYQLPVSHFNDSIATNKYMILQRELKSEEVKEAQEIEQVAISAKSEEIIKVSEEGGRERNAAKMASRIRMASTGKAILLLKGWVPKHRKPEATEKTVIELKTLKLQSAI